MTKIKEGMRVVSVAKNPIVGIVVKIGDHRVHPHSSMIDVIDLAGKYRSIIAGTVKRYKPGAQWNAPQKEVQQRKQRFIRRKREQTA